MESTKEKLLALLEENRGRSLSGQELALRLGISRAAVWKEISALRQAGWPIVSAPRLGYRLEGTPPILSGAYLSGKLSQDSLFSGKILVEDRVDSTNTRLKAMAAQGAAEGTVLLAEEQSGGRGTSLAMGGYETERNTLAVGILEAFEELYRKFPWGQPECLEEYRSHCMTLGRRVASQAGEQTLEGVALSVGEDFSLLVRGEDGREHRVSSGTVRLL